MALNGTSFLRPLLGASHALCCLTIALVSSNVAAQTVFKPYPLINFAEARVQRMANAGAITNLEWEIGPSGELQTAYDAHAVFRIDKEGGQPNEQLRDGDLVRLKIGFREDYRWLAADPARYRLVASSLAVSPAPPHSLFRLRYWLEGIGPVPMDSPMQMNLSSWSLEVVDLKLYALTSMDGPDQVRLSADPRQASEFIFSTPVPGVPFPHFPGAAIGPPSNTGGGQQPPTQDGAPYICFGSEQLNFAGCKGTYVYVCSTSARPANVTLSYRDVDGSLTTTRTSSVQVPAGARIGNGAPQLPGGSVFAPNVFGSNGVCQTRGWSITAVGQ